jgi:FtsP/CotA-like multicopper oxidase with cupredoxin domain
MLPGPVVRATAGDLIRVTLHNQLPAETSIHWHGIAVRNAADGVPGLTQDAVRQGSTFPYEFVAPDPGTHFYHPHVGVQLDRGLYAPLIIDDPHEPGAYDEEWIVVLDDWIDGTGKTPDDVLAELTASTSSPGSMGGMDMGGMDMGEGGMDMPGMGGMNMGSGDSPFGDAGDVTYPHYLVNDLIASAPDVLRAKPGQRVRIRVINAASDTIFAVALAGHRQTITHTDGFAVQPKDTDGFYVGMGERYDVIVTLRDGVFPLVAKPVGKDGAQARALIRTGSGAPPAPDVEIRELTGNLTTVRDLRPAEASRLPAREPGQHVELRLSGQMSPYAWAINGAPFPKNKPIRLSAAERVRVRLTNHSMMTHPMHIHGHTFALPGGLRKDTVLLTPMQTIDVDLQTDNPGNWAAHCHNIYHAEAGMMAALVYQS